MLHGTKLGYARSEIDEGTPMATQADFNADEWSTILEGPLLAGMRVVAAERGGAMG